ncbi:MAG: tRNA guanosine(34) transglycosylase Tgt [bacterium]
MGAITFKIEARAPHGGARAGVITTAHGAIRTPAFVPVGTKADVKGILPELLAREGAQVVLANTYHLYLQPGEAVVKEAGGLAKFMNWRGPTMTDSGGFQVFSLGAAFGKKVSKFSGAIDGEMSEKEDQIAVFDDSLASQHGQLAIVDDEGVTFTSHLDGSLHRFTPERSVEIQHALGADIFFAFDECTAPTEPYAYQKEAMERTHRWAGRSLKAHRQNIGANRMQAIFGIAQGGQFDDLRRISAREIGDMGFDGFGLGGSFSKKYGEHSLESALKMLSEIPPEMPVHGLGVGEPGDILLGIAHGVDLFDCVAATRIGRHGSIYTKRGVLHLRGEKFRNDFSVLDPETPMESTAGFTRAYVGHLIRSGETLGSVICSLHNLGFILRLVDGAREAITKGHFDEYRAAFLSGYYGR